MNILNTRLLLPQKLLVIATALILTVGNPMSLKAQGVAEKVQSKGWEIKEEIHLESLTTGLSRYNVSDNFSENFFKGSYYLNGSFWDIADSSKRSQLLKNGIRVDQRELSGVYRIVMAENADLSKCYELGLESVFSVSDESKAGPGVIQVLNTDELSEARLLLNVYTIDRATVESTLRQIDGVTLGDWLSSMPLLSISANKGSIRQVLQLPFVAWVELEPTVATPLTGNFPDNHHAGGVYFAPGSASGAGIKVGVVDEFEWTYKPIDLKGRFEIGELRQGGTRSYFTHGVIVSGILAGAGNMDPARTGVAPGAELYRSNIGITGMTWLVDSMPDLKIVNNSWVERPRFVSDDCDFAGRYNSHSYGVDDMCNDDPTLFVAFGAGNEPPKSGTGCAVYRNIAGGANSSKNSLAVGGNANRGFYVVNSFNKGPAKDGRIKPEIVALGRVNATYLRNGYITKDGTSFSTPIVSGYVARMHEWYKSRNNGAIPESALIKALLCNNATDLGTKGPDWNTGYGYLNMRRTMEAFENGQYRSRNIRSNRSGISSFGITVPRNVKQLRVMLVWNDPAAAPGTGTNATLVHDLDLQVRNSSVNHKPWVLTVPNNNMISAASKGRDQINNMEQVTIDNPASGTSYIRVEHGRLPANQKYWVTWTFIKDEVDVTYPVWGERFKPNSTIVVSWDYNEGKTISNTGNSIKFSTNGYTWTRVKNLTAAEVRNKRIRYTLPSNRTQYARVKVTIGGISSVSDVFTIGNVPTNVEIESAGNQVEVDWNYVSGAAWYKVYRLGDKYMEYIGSSEVSRYTDRNPPSDKSELSYAVTAMLRESGRSETFEGPRSKTTIIEKPRYTLDAKLTSCKDNEPVKGSVEIENVYGTPPISWTWSDANHTTGGISSSGLITGNKLTDLPAGTYRIVVRGADGSRIEDSVTIVPARLRILDVRVTPSEINKSTGSIEVISTRTESRYTWINQQTNTQTTSTIRKQSELASGMYTVKITGSPCEASTEVFVPEKSYCTVRGYSNNTNEWIDYFAVEGYDTIRTGNNDPNSYLNHTGWPVFELTQGETYDFTLGVGITSSRRYFNEGYSVFMDLNHDGDFSDQGELINARSHYFYSPLDESTLPITIPSSATVGPTRMRIILQYNSFETNGCTNTTFSGEIEDYTVRIRASSSPVLTANKPNSDRDLNIIDLIPNPSHDRVMVICNTSDFEGATDEMVVSLYDVAGKKVLESPISTHTKDNVSQELIVEHLSEGVYTVKIHSGSSLVGTSKLIKTGQ